MGADHLGGALSLTTDIDEAEPQRVEIEGAMPEGIYFGLPEDDYHAAPALSNSGIKWLRVSPLDFYMRSWMNPEYEHESSVFMVEGTAWHKRILEGREAFYAAYAADIDPADYPGALRTVFELKEFCRSMKLPTSGTKAELIARMVEKQPSVAVGIWDLLVAEHKAANAGKILLPFDMLRRIELQAAMIEKHPDISRCFSGGYPEVSVFWLDASGVPMKARLDYLKPRAIIDLKTHSNPHGRPIDDAINGAMAQGRYHVQVAVYWQAWRTAIRHIRDGKVFGQVDRAWLKAAADTPEDDRQFVFVFQQTGIAPVARAKVFSPQLAHFTVAESVVSQCIADFAAHWHRYGTDPWVDTTAITYFADEDFPPWMTRT